MYNKKQLRPHQKKAADRTIKYFDAYDRGFLSMACGTGKSLTFRNIDELLDSVFTLILVPSLYLLSQIYNMFSREYFKNE